MAELSRETGALAERQRLAGEIHDALAQGFTSVILLLQAAQAALERGDPESARRSLALAEPAARDGLDEARSLIAALSPLPLQGASLVGAIERVCADVGPRFGFVANLEVTGEVRDLSNNAEIVLLRAAQEALANVGRHANATFAAVRLSFGGTVTSLEVADDGVGFDANGPVGFGLSQLRSRVADLGGNAEVIAARGEGTTVRVLLPADGPDVPLRVTNAALSATAPEVP
jgi:signal transduction histidine kinase